MNWLKYEMNSFLAQNKYFFGQNSEFSLYQEIGKYLEVVENEEQIIELVVHSKVSIAFITVIDHLRFVGMTYGEESFHLPQPSEESSFFLDFISIGFRPHFKHILDFDDMYAFFRY